MIVWQICADEIGNNGAGAVYCGTKREAMRVLREWREWRREKGQDTDVTSGPDKLVLRNKEAIVNAINDAMGYGCS